MIALVAAAVLAATPRAHPAAGLSVYIPRLEKVSGVTDFMRAAGRRAPVLNPAHWRSELSPLLSLDPGDPAALLAAGIDPAGSATLSYVGDAKISCLTLKDPKRFVERAGEKLASAGEPWKSSAGGVPLVGASIAGRVRLGYALKGKEACAVGGQSSNVATLLTEAAKLVAKAPLGPEWKKVSSMPGAAFVVSRYGTTGLIGSAGSLTAEGRATRVPLPALAPAGPHPYAGVAPSGLAFVRARVTAEGRGAMKQTLLGQLLEVCGACEPTQTSQLADALLARLTGAVMLRVDGVKVRESLRSTSARYFAVRHAWVAEVNGTAAVKAGLARLESWKGVRKTLGGLALTARGGEVLVGLRGSHLYVGNDPAAVEAALEGLEGKAGRLAHGAEWVVNPEQVADGLSQIPLFDVLGSQDLAALFAAGTELGPLLTGSAGIVGWADSAGDGNFPFQAIWTLKEPRPAPGGG